MNTIQTEKTLEYQVLHILRQAGIKSPDGVHNPYRYRGVFYVDDLQAAQLAVSEAEGGINIDALLFSIRPPH